MNCLFCHSKENKKSFLPSTFFNNKKFDYYQCKKCELIYIHPIPNNDDLIKMYPPTYQDGVNREILADMSKKIKGLRFSYQEHFNLFESINFNGSMIDFGCGSANFIINANHYGFNCDGAEFSPTHIEILRNEIPSSKFYTIDEFFNDSNKKYDLIRLSNVFEHFTDPFKMLSDLKSKLTPNGYLLIEGPVETNFNLAFKFRKLYFKFRKVIQPNRLVTHTPTHIIFTNRKNQQQVLKEVGFKQLQFKLQESAWPFPSKFSDAKGVVQKLNVIIAKISILFSKGFKNWGNTFLYLGQKGN